MKIERDLMELLPEREWTDYTLRGIYHGRVCCDAKRPDCDACPLASECPWPRGDGAKPARKTARKKTARGRAHSGSGA